MTKPHKFGKWTFDSDANVVSDGRATTPLEPQVARLLEYLLQHQHELLTRERLLHDVWDQRVVSDDAIQRCIGILRQTLTPHDKQAYVRTVARKGYIAVFPPAAAAAVSRPPATAGHRARGARIAAGALACALVAGLGLYLAGARQQPPAAGTPLHAAGELASIAVLPFADLSPNRDQAYFADGVSEEILNLLAGTPELRVIARTSSFSFRNQGTDLATIADRLKVTHVLEGSVRRSGERVRVVAQLVETGTAVQRWSGRFDRELGDILALQKEIAVGVATALEASQGIRPGTRERTVDPQAFDLYLRGMQGLQSWTGAALVDAETAFRQSLAFEPEFGRAHYGLGVALLLQVIHEVRPLHEVLPRLREVIALGLQQTPDNAGLIALQGQVARYDGDRVLAERYLGHALEMESSDAWIRNLYCFLKMDLGQPAEALRVQQRTLDIDPLNPAVYVPLAFGSLDLRRPADALAAAQRFKALNSPANDTALMMNAIIKVVVHGDFAGAIAEAAQSLDPARSADFLWMAEWLAFDLYTIGERDAGDSWVDRMRQAATDDDAWVVETIEAYAALVDGKPDAFRAMRAERLMHRYDYRRVEDFDMYLLADEMIARGEAQRAVDTMLAIAPEWGRYKSTPTLDADEFYPASALVKSAYSSYPALHFAPFIRALQAAGDRDGADIMLAHLETILDARLDRGLFVEEMHVAEARALRGDGEGALDALERAERDRTIYMRWQMRLLHNGIFEEIRATPRFLALIDRIGTEMARQRALLAAALARDVASAADASGTAATGAH